MSEEKKVRTGLRERNKLRVRTAIRRASVELVESKGFQAVSVEDIVEAAGVSRTTFFNYFPSKEAVLAAPSPEVLERQRVVCAARPADEALWQSLSAVVLDLVAVGEEDLRIMKRLKAASPELGDLLHKSNKEVMEALASWAGERAPLGAEEDAQVLVSIFLASAETHVDLWDLDEPITAVLARLKDLHVRLGRAFDA